MVFIPGRSVNIENERTFIDGEEVFPSNSQNIISEGTNGAGDVVIGNFENSNPVNNEQNSIPNPDLSQPIDNNDSTVSNFSNISISSPDVIADGGQTIVGGSGDIIISDFSDGNFPPGEANDISGVTDTYEEVNKIDFELNNPIVNNTSNTTGIVNLVSSEIQSLEINITNSSLGNEVSCFDDCIEQTDMNFLNSSLDSHFESGETFI